MQALLSTIPRIRIIELADGLPADLGLAISRPPSLALLESDNSTDQVWITLRELKLRSPRTKCIVLVENVQQQQAEDAADAEAVLLQGISPHELVGTIERLLDQETTTGNPLEAEE